MDVHKSYQHPRKVLQRDIESQVLESLLAKLGLNCSRKLHPCLLTPITVFRSRSIV